MLSPFLAWRSAGKNVAGALHQRLIINVEDGGQRVQHMRRRLTDLAAFELTEIAIGDFLVRGFLYVPQRHRYVLARFAQIGPKRTSGRRSRRRACIPLLCHANHLPRDGAASRSS